MKPDVYGNILFTVVATISTRNSKNQIAGMPAVVMNCS